ncbi:glycosyl hydrolase family 18 protein [Alicyclobacillus mali (ex Roth et al. 2021)]|uniref:glycosyl hydrolase family 18 protein n=1 Tax=Alicyclobacillus mali (ex Roth et al. 2021) TaxID=1123961 RepID=UPI00082F2A33|nr:glycosyl hydrolase family 18 protein [Alicyclobacillus mali (ex Roth et al. 2021)]
MEIHRVEPGETPADIASKYGVSLRDLLRYNELASKDVIAPGIALILPKGPPVRVIRHVVKAGDTLNRLAHRYGVPSAVIANWNPGLPADGPLPVGFTVNIPGTRSDRRTIELNAYLVPEGNENDQALLQDVSDLTYVCAFSYRVQPTGDLDAPKDRSMLDAAAKFQIAPMATLTNFNGNRFNPDLAHAILHSTALANRVVDQIVRVCEEKGYRGVNVDFEHMPPGDRAAYTAFIRTLGKVLRPRGLSLSLALGPKTSDEAGAPWMGAFDYAALGDEADFVMLMTYEWGWVGGPPMPVAPVDRVASVLEYATGTIDPKKILMGMTLYGYDWPLPYMKGKTRAASIANNDAQNLAIAERVPVEWDLKAASPHFAYETAGTKHEVWYDDALSAAVKLALVDAYGLRGVSLWVLGNEFPQLWYLLKDGYKLEKK